jgi:hypothetical protein
LLSAKKWQLISAIQVEKFLPEGLQLRGQLPFCTGFPFNRVELEAERKPSVRAQT